MLYELIKPLLFKLNEETAHALTLKSLALLNRLSLLHPPQFNPKPVSIMNLQFPHVVGIAAGLDKNGDYIDALGNLGFGFIEIGTVTPKPQAGNPRPRLFRLDQASAIINRMGFNNKGVAYVRGRLKKIKYRGILGINIGKNRDTPIAQAVDDYRYAFRQLAPYASYITINISSPNTKNLRDLQAKEALYQLLDTIKNDQAQIAKTIKYVPIVLKISPDLNDEALSDIATVLLDLEIDGVIATNTTLTRTGILDSPLAQEEGGLSGRPLFPLSTDVLSKLNQLLQNKIPIIASGGVMTHQDVDAKLANGAQLVQVYSGLIFNGLKQILI